MLILVINEDEYKLFANIKKQILLKRELLSKYRDNDIVMFYDGEKLVDECRLCELFNREKI